MSSTHTDKPSADKSSIVIIDNFDSFTYNLYQMIQSVSNSVVRVFRNNAIDCQGILDLKPSHVVLSPGPGHPARPGDFGVCTDLIQAAEKEAGFALLGVCLGHQGIAHCLGGKVIQAPEIMHGKTSWIYPTQNSVIFRGLPAPFKAMRYHSLVVEHQSFPSHLEITAQTQPVSPEQPPLIMGLQHKTHPIYGVQFHPESIGTPEGQQMLRNFIEHGNDKKSHDKSHRAG